MVPEGAGGAGVFAVPAIDPERGVLCAGTQNAYSSRSAPFGNPTSVVALDAGSGQERWVFHAPPGGGETVPTEDVGFSASPNLYSITVKGQRCDLIGEGQKSGIYWALDRDTSDVVWQSRVSPAGPLGGVEGTSAVAGEWIAVPATDWPDPSGPAAGRLTILDAATGEGRWSADSAAPVVSPVAIAGDVVIQGGLDGVLHAYDIGGDRELWRFDVGASIGGGIAISGGTLVLGAATPAFAPFVRGGRDVVAFRLCEDTGTPVMTPTAAMS